MSESMYNIYDEEVEIRDAGDGEELEGAVVVKFPDGYEREFVTYESAVKYLYRRGWIF